MASLRRPSHLPPRTNGPPASFVPKPSQLAAPENAVSNLDARRKSRVGDRIRTRMSMRYVGTEEQAPPMPGKDFLQHDPYQGDTYDEQGDEAEGSGFNERATSELKQSFGSRGDEGIHRRGATDLSKEDDWDLDEMIKDDFDLQGFLKRTLTGADEDEVKRFKAALERYKQANAKDLQRNVFKHYAEFVTMSKEIATLENDMLELKDLLHQWKDLPQLMGMEDTLAPTLDKNGNLERRRTHRNSVADLAHMYKAQLSNLWSTVEGSQRYIPLAPGRHTVFDTHNFVELNAATYKAKQSVSMFLLNDLLLIAGRRRTKTAANGADQGGERERGRMVAERCWVLADLVVVDVKDSGDLTNALKIRRGKEVCVYRSAKAEDKKALLSAFRQVSQELGEKKRKENEKEQQRRKSMWQGDAPAAPVPGLLTSGRPATMVMTMSDSKDIQWIDDFGDELTMFIAMRDWDAAVSLIERSEDMLRIAAPNVAAVESLTGRLNHLRPALIGQLAHDLSSPDLRKAGASRLVALLSRLDSADLARDTFLRSRREVMMQRVRGIKCDGDTTIYVSELAIVCFTILRHTSDWYMTAFKENKMASGFIVWAKEQIETFADMFRRQVYAPTIPEGVSDECMRVVASHNRKLLRDVGLDFTFLLSTLISPDPTSSQDIPTLNPMFDMSAPTPAAGYHIEPSPYPSFDLYDDADVPGSPMEPTRTTAPLSINPNRRPRLAKNGELTPVAESSVPS